MLHRKFISFLDTSHSRSNTPLLQEKIDVWVAEQPKEEQSEARLLARIWSLSKAEEPEVDSSQTQCAWQKLQAQLELRSTPLRVVRRLSRPWHAARFLRWSVATAAAVLLITSLYLLQKTEDAPALIRVACSSTEPKQVLLPDGTKIWLNSGATVEYPASFSTSARSVYLSEGRVFFDVHKDLTRPFTVYAPTLNIRVEGTSFDLHYSEEKSILSVTEGRVRVESPERTFSPLLLTEGQQLLLTPEARHIQNIQDKSYLSWRLSFRDTPLKEVLTMLSDYYDTPLTLSSRISRCAITASFQDLTLNEAVALVATLTKATKTPLQGGGYLLQPSRCP